MLAYEISRHGSNPRSDIFNAMKYEKYFLPRLTLSEFVTITLRVNKIATKKFPKNLLFRIDFQL